MCPTTSLQAASSQSVVSNVPVPIPFGQLRRSKKNMRTISPVDNSADREMLASIRDKGILQNLCAYKVDDVYEVPAGGRRFGALEILHKEGVIDAEFPVYCLLISEEQAGDISLVENYHRKAPHPADVYTAFTKLIDGGTSVDELARSHGITQSQVEKYLRLGKVHNTLFKFFRKDLLSIEQIMAYASSADKKLQIAAFKSLGEDCTARPSSIRATIQENRQASTSALAKFVTLDAYMAAGGATENDMFTDTTMLCDVVTLVEMAEAKLAAAVATLEGWKWTKISMEGAHCLYQYQQLPCEELPIPPEQAAKQTAIVERLDVLEKTSGDDWTDEAADEYDELSDRLDKLSEKLARDCKDYNVDDRAFGGCIVTFDQETGELEIHRGLLTHDDLKAYHAKDAEEDTKTDKKELPAEKPELSARLTADMGIYRRNIIKAELASNPVVAIDILHFQLCADVLSTGYSGRIRFLDISLSDVSNETSLGDYQSTVASKTMDSTYASLDISWLSLKSEIKQFDAFRALPQTSKQSLVSYCVAVQLLQGCNKPGNDKVIDSIVAELGVSFKKYWRPTAENYLSRMTKPLLVSMARKWKGAAWANKHADLSKKVIVQSLHDIFHNSPDSLNDKEKDIRTHWMPPEISK